MPDQTVLDMKEPAPQAGPALSATSDMPEKVAAPAVSEEKIPADQKQENGEAKPEGETPADASADQTGAAEAGKQADGEKKPDDQTPPWMKAEITKERNRRRVAEQRADKLQDDLSKALTGLEKLGAAPKEVKAAETEARPKRESFDNPEAYDSALIEWSARLATKTAQATLDKERVEADRRRVETEQGERNKATLDGFNERKATFVKDHPDYEDVVENDDVQISTPMAHAILNDDDGPAIAYYLGKNPDEAARISKLNPIKAVAELGRIAARLAARPAPTNKPAPIRPLKTGAAAATAKSPNEESMEEYAARRQPQILASRKPFIGGGPKPN